MESRRFVYLPAAIFITEDLFDDKFDVTKLVILSTFFTAGQWDRRPGETCRTFAKFTGFVRQTDGFREDCKSSRPRWLSWMRHPTGDQEVAGSTPAEVGNILS